MSNRLLDNIAELKNSIDGVVSMTGADVEYLKNADKVEHTTNVGKGKELVPVDVLSQQVYDAVRDGSNFMNKFNGYHGTNMAVSKKLPIIGDIGLAEGNTEWTTGAGALSQGTNTLDTGEVTITQAPMKLTLDISNRLLNHSIIDLETTVNERLNKAAIRTVEAMVINADSSNLSTGNVNCDDAVPTATFANGAKHYSLQLDNGIRKITVNWTANIDYKDIGELTYDKLIDTRGLLGEYSYDLDALLLLFNGATYNKTLTIDEFKENYQNGVASTITDGKLPNKLSGVEYVVCKDFGKTEADGKQSATASSNTKGGFSYIYKPAVQWGWGQPAVIGVTPIQGKGIQVIITFEIGITIVNKKAGATDPSVVTGINVTV